MVSVAYPGRSPGRWLVQSEFTSGLGPSTDSFFFTQLSATTAKRTALNLMQITAVPGIDKVEAGSLSQLNLEGGVLQAPHGEGKEGCRERV